jgi:glycosyltransferase involved in cell wall biosynthesis
LRLLFLVPFPPRRDGGHGGSRAVAELITRLAEHHQVALVHLRGVAESRADEALLERCDLVRAVPKPATPDRRGRLGRRLRVAGALLRGTPTMVAGGTHPDFAAAVRDVARTWRPDIVQLEYHVMGAYLEALEGIRAPRVLRQLEPGAATAADRTRYRPGVARFTGALERRAWTRYEQSVMTRVDAVVALTPRDAEDLRRLAGGTPVECIPLGVALPRRPYDPAGVGERLVYVGNYAHSPNVEAVDRLIQVILPGVRRSCPGAVLEVVGAHAPDRWLGREHAGVTVVGSVPTVDPFLDRASVIVVPLASGGGMRVKVLEALAGGKAVVATPRALEGLDVQDGLQVRIAQTDEDLIMATVALLRDPEARKAFGARARAWALATLGWDGPVAAFERLYARLAAR